MWKSESRTGYPMLYFLDHLVSRNPTRFHLPPFMNMTDSCRLANLTNCNRVSRYSTKNIFYQQRTNIDISVQLDAAPIREFRRYSLTNGSAFSWDNNLPSYLSQNKSKRQLTYVRMVSCKTMRKKLVRKY